MNTKRLKAKILDLAIHGKLVPQNPNDESAAVLLEKIRKEKGGESIPLGRTSLRPTPSSGGHPRNAPDASISEDDIPFDIPEGWVWCYGYEIFSPMTSRNPSGDNFKYIDIEVVDNKRNKIDSPKIIPVYKAPSRASRETFPGDILFSMVRPYLRNIALVTDTLTDCIASTGFFVCRPRKPLFSKYIFYLMTSNYVVNGINQFMKGDNSPSVNGDDILNFLYPLPPLAEQQRIVDAIEKAFEQIDIIEKNKLDLKTYIKQTKSKILDLAIRGKLLSPADIAQCRNKEESATALLEKIRNEKAELIKQKKLKPDPKSSIIIKAADGKHCEQFPNGTLKDIEDEIPFEIPEGWAWCRLREIAFIERGGSPRPIGDFLTTKPDGINWIKIGDTKKGDKYIENVKEKIKPEGIKSSRMVHAGDFLLSNSMSFGRPYILKIDGCIHDGWLVFGNVEKCITSDYLFNLLTSPFIYESFELTAAGSTVKNLNKDRVKEVLFPLPPLSEQQRIVEAIEKSFEQLDKIEKSLGE